MPISNVTSEGQCPQYIRAEQNISMLPCKMDIWYKVAMDLPLTGTLVFICQRVLEYLVFSKTSLH